MFVMKKIALLTLAAVGAALVAGCTTYGSNGYAGVGAGYADNGWGYYDRGYYSRYGAYDYNRPDPRYNGYYADRYYRADPRYRERVLSSNDRVYVGQDGRYYCRRDDGTTGLIVGGIAGGVLGNIIAPGGSKTIGTIIGAGAGAAAGAAIDSSSGDVRCR
jgi:hypothetical protein